MKVTENVPRLLLKQEWLWFSTTVVTVGVATQEAVR